MGIGITYPNVLLCLLGGSSGSSSGSKHVVRHALKPFFKVFYPSVCGCTLSSLWTSACRHVDRYFCCCGVGVGVGLGVGVAIGVSVSVSVRVSVGISARDYICCDGSEF
jgi:hypothetical protein